MTQRWKITIEYDGRPFVGWQRQENGPSVQAALERAIHGFSRESPTVHAAGRTDAGVHALGMVASFDLDRPLTPEKLREAMTALLRPDPVAVLTAETVADDFHARFSCQGRAYLYRILDRRAPPALDAGRVWHVPHRLEVGAMQDAAQHLIGRHDFTSVRAAQCQAQSPEKTLDRLEVTRAGAEIHIVARARSFLHHQVRNMVGTLKLVGEGRWSGDDVARALAARDRAAAGPTAPPDGLYFTEAWY